MTRVNKITLISEETTTDNIGQIVTYESRVSFVGEVRSVSRAEFVQGNQIGLTPSYMFRVSRFGYSGQKILEYDGIRYSIYRTYEADDDSIELYAEVQIGATNV